MEFDSKRKLAAEIFDWVETVAKALSAVVLIFIFVVRLIAVNGLSMYPTLHDHDQIVISNLFYDEPKQGDIVVLRKTSFIETPIVKRIIATEGQIVDINFETHKVYVDGEELHEDYINEATELSGTTSFPLKVDKGCVFVMGDNRNHSSDSRDARLGVVDKRHILGRVIFRVFPFDRIGTVE